MGFLEAIRQVTLIFSLDLLRARREPGFWGKTGILKGLERAPVRIALVSLLFGTLAAFLNGPGFPQLKSFWYLQWLFTIFFFSFSISEQQVPFLWGGTENPLRFLPVSLGAVLISNFLLAIGSAVFAGIFVGLPAAVILLYKFGVAAFLVFLTTASVNSLIVTFSLLPIKAVICRIFPKKDWAEIGGYLQISLLFLSFYWLIRVVSFSLVSASGACLTATPWESQFG